MPVAIQQAAYTWGYLFARKHLVTVDRCFKFASRLTPTIDDRLMVFIIEYGVSCPLDLQQHANWVSLMRAVWDYSDKTEAADRRAIRAAAKQRKDTSKRLAAEKEAAEEAEQERIVLAAGPTIQQKDLLRRGWTRKQLKSFPPDYRAGAYCGNVYRHNVCHYSLARVEAAEKSRAKPPGNAEIRIYIADWQNFVKRTYATPSPIQPAAGRQPSR
jgi:hypothetical protein